MNWSALASAAVAGAAAGYQAWRDRRKAASERLADKPRPIQEAVRAGLERFRDVSAGD